GRRGRGPGGRDRLPDDGAPAPDDVAAHVAQLVKRPRQRLRHDVVAAHRMADLDGPAGELVDLGRFARQAAPMRHLQVAERKQTFQVLEGNRPMNPSLTRYVLDAPWLAIGIEPEKD